MFKVYPIIGEIYCSYSKCCSNFSHTINFFIRIDHAARIDDLLRPAQRVRRREDHVGAVRELPKVAAVLNVHSPDLVTRAEQWHNPLLDERSDEGV